MKENYEIDKLDREILTYLLKDSRMPFQEMARKLVVSGGTIHVRVNKMKEMGIIKGSKIELDFTKLGLTVAAFIGVNLKTAGDYQTVIDQLKVFKEVVEVHYTTGSYSLFVKVFCATIQDLHLFLSGKLQSIEAIRSTETFISLDSPLNREAPLI